MFGVIYGYCPGKSDNMIIFFSFDGRCMNFFSSEMLRPNKALEARKPGQVLFIEKSFSTQNYERSVISGCNAQPTQFFGFYSAQTNSTLSVNFCKLCVHTFWLICITYVAVEFSQRNVGGVHQAPLHLYQTPVSDVLSFIKKLNNKTIFMALPKPTDTIRSINTGSTGLPGSELFRQKYIIYKH